jgi:excisionase family DNA binding protein
MNENPTAQSQNIAANANIAASAASPSPYVLGVEEAAKFLRIGRVKLFQLLKSRAIRSRKIGKRRVILVESLIRYVNNAPQD